MRMIIGLLPVLGAVAACAVNPATGRREFSLVSEGQEIAMGQQGAESVEQSIGLYPDPELQTYVMDVGMRMAALSERPQLPWRFGVVEDAAINAFALPGGPIYFTRGILTHMNSEAEMASVMGHEIGHVTARHSAQQISRASAFQLGLGLGSAFSNTVAAFSGLASDGLGVLLLKYGRDAETQADELGFRYMTASGYDPRAMKDMFAMLGRVSEGAGRLPTWLSTHPTPDDRLARTETRLTGTTLNYATLTRKQDEFFRRIEGLVYGENPRNGFFLGRSFHHPDLRFKFTFPDGWQLQNGTSAVAGINPSQDAILEIRLDDATNVATAMASFAGQNGVSVERPDDSRVNGLTAQTAEFEASSGQGRLRGRVSFLALNNRVYRVMGFATSQAYGNNRQAIVSSLASFAEERDQAMLARQPNRIRVVTLPKAMNIPEFVATFPSAIPPEQAALINGVTLDERLAAGRKLKQVVPGN